MLSSSDDTWSGFDDSVDKLQRRISLSKAVKVNAASLREQTREVAQFYFRQTRPELQALGVEADLISQLDASVQRLLRLSSAASGKRSYLTLLKSLSNTIRDVTVAIEVRHAEQAFLSRSPQSDVLSGNETIIYETLLKLVPTAALSYKQAVIDLADKNRISYRGVANEFREALRETLDHLAPDKAITSQPGFKYEQDKKTPTMKQKVRFILRARELPDNAVKPPEDAVALVEERIASLTRSVYERSSISTHVANQRSEIIQMKKYVDAVLAELLGLQA